MSTVDQILAQARRVCQAPNTDALDFEIGGLRSLLFAYDARAQALQTALANIGQQFGIPVAVPVVVEEPKLSDDQQRAWAKLSAWVLNDKRYFVLRGFAGTGKTFLMKKLSGLSKNVYFTAPTNKASQVLSLAVGQPTKTTFSLLGIRMKQVEDRLVLTFGDDLPNLPANSIIVVDEASMLNSELVEFIERVAEATGCKVLFVGDPAQLNPIGEKTSPCWSVTDDPACRAVLKQVMRFDNNLLALSVEIRECLKNKDWRTPLIESRGSEIAVVTEREFLARLCSHTIDDFVNTKACAWRNKTVNRYTKAIRQKLGFKHEYEESELILLADPIERDGTIIAHTDEEFRVTARRESVIRVHDTSIPVYQLEVSGERKLSLAVPIDDAPFDALLTDLANTAHAALGRDRAKAWREFWDTKGRFNRIRYAYAMTAHRLQGSTLKHVYLDQHDMLANPTKREAFRCFYVGATRASEQLTSF